MNVAFRYAKTIGLKNRINKKQININQSRNSNRLYTLLPALKITEMTDLVKDTGQAIRNMK